MNETTRRRATKELSPKDAAAKDFLKKFKKVMQSDLRYQEYFLKNDKAITYYNIKEFYKKEVLTNQHSEQELVIALHIVLSKGWILSKTKLAEAFDYKVTRIPPIDVKDN